MIAQKSRPICAGSTMRRLLAAPAAGGWRLRLADLMCRRIETDLEFPESLSLPFCERGSCMLFIATNASYYIKPAAFVKEVAQRIHCHNSFEGKCSGGTTDIFYDLSPGRQACLNEIHLDRIGSTSPLALGWLAPDGNSRSRLWSSVALPQFAPEV